MAQTLQKKFFRDIDLEDSFFDSLKADYKEFPNWFAKKQNNEAFVFYSTNGGLDGFLYLKKEKEQIGSNEVQEIDVERLKIGTFKINPHGTRLGERFLKRAFDVAIANNLTQVYVTVFAKHVGLVDLFVKYGFDLVGQKKSENGVEGIYLKDFNKLQKTVASNYPKIPIKKDRHFALSLYPKWHTRLLPDSLLANENETIITDVSHTNSIHKIYLTSMGGVDQLLVGDTLLIYRTADGGSGYYTSVITSIGVVEDVRHIGSFDKQEDFLHYCLPYSIFTEAELINFYSTKKYPFLIQFTYNLALTKKINRKLLIEEVGISRDAYAGFFKITTIQLKKILTLSTDYEKKRSLFYTS